MAVGRVRWGRVAVGGVAAGLIVNAVEYGVHRIVLDDAWTAAFRALGKNPTGWSAFIPANFFVGLLMVWAYSTVRSRYGGGLRITSLIGFGAWVIFWVIPLMAMVPLDLFPGWLLAVAIGLGLVDAAPGALAGAWLYDWGSV